LFVQAKLHEAEKRAVSLKSDGDEAAHALRTSLAAAEVKHVQDMAARDREATVLREAVATADRRVALAEKQVEEMTAELVQKEEEAGARLHAAREQEWAKLREAEAARSELEAKVSSSHREASAGAAAWATREATLVAAADQQRQRSESLDAEKRRLERELEDARQKLSAHEPLLAAAELQKEEVRTHTQTL
jgi:chromosome segregation ATPase